MYEIICVSRHEFTTASMLKMWNMKTESLPVWAPHPLSHQSSACCIFTPFLSLSHPTSWCTHMSSWHPAATPPHWRHWFSAIGAPPLPFSPGSLLWVPLHTDLLCETAAQSLHSAHFPSALTEERTTDGRDKDDGSVSFFLKSPVHKWRWCVENCTN